MFKEFNLENFRNLDLLEVFLDENREKKMNYLSDIKDKNDKNFVLPFKKQGRV